jgi:hypothetical protein
VLSREHLQAVLTIATGLRDRPVDWAFTGSGAVALHGVDVPCRDLDVQTDAVGAALIVERFSAAATGEARDINTPEMAARATYLEMAGVIVEVLADIRAPDPEGRWRRSPLASHVTWISVAPGVHAPVLSLPRLLDIAEALKRVDTAGAIRRALGRHPPL